MLKDEIKAMPDKIRTSETKMIDAVKKLTAIKRALEEREREIYAQICSEMDDRGSKKFSNDTMRQAEAGRRMKINEEYKTLLKNLDTAQREHDEAKIEYDHDINTFSALKAITRIPEAAEA